MDLVKIGKYIAEKRKALGLTQRQVAEKLGMSDKSVSKWERGICLPDVSVYSPLCEILGISLNEFLAGKTLDRTTCSRSRRITCSGDDRWEKATEDLKTDYWKSYSSYCGTGTVSGNAALQHPCTTELYRAG